MTRTPKKIDFSSSKKQTILNLLAYVSSFLATTVISFILTPFLVNKLGKEVYSFYPIANSIVNYMIIATSALNTMASRFVSISLLKNKNEDASKYFSSTLFVDLLLSVVLGVVSLVIILFVDKFFDVPFSFLSSIRLLFILIFASAIVNVLSSVFGIATFAKNKISWRSARELASSILRMIIIIVLYLFLPPNIIYIGIAAVSIALFSLFLQYIFTKKLIPEVSISRKLISKEHVKELFVSSVWVVVNSLGQQLLAGTTTIMANILYGASFSGNLSLALTIPSFLGGVVSAMVFAFYPVVTKKYALDSTEDLAKQICKVQAIVGCTVCAIISVFTAVSKSFFTVWVPTENAVELSSLCLIYNLVYYVTSCFWVLTVTATAMNKVKIPAIANLVFGFVSIIMMVLLKYAGLNYFMLPIVAAIMQIIWQAIFLPIYISRCLKTKSLVFYLPFFKCVVISIVVFAISYVVTLFVSIDSWIRIVLFAFLIGLPSLCLYYLLFFPKPIKSMIKKILARFLKR